MAAHQDNVLFNVNTFQVGHLLVEREIKETT